MDNFIISKLKDKKLTKVERKIAEYFVENQYEIMQKTLVEIANETGTSDASIIRFTRTMGYNGFTDLKNDLYNKMTEEIGKMSLKTRFDKNVISNNDQYALDTYIDVITSSVEKTLKQNDIKDYNKVVNLLMSSNRKCIIGFSGTKGLSLQLGRNLSFVIDDVAIITDESNDAISKLQGYGEDDFIIYFSFARYYNFDQILSDFLRERKVKVCAITDSLSSPISRYADIVLRVDTKNISFFNSAIAANCVSEFILNLLAIKNKAITQERLNDFDKSTEDLRNQ